MSLKFCAVAAPRPNVCSKRRFFFRSFIVSSFSTAAANAFCAFILADSRGPRSSGKHSQWLVGHTAAAG